MEEILLKVLPQNAKDIPDRHRELHPVLCDNLEGWDGVGDGREAQEGGDMCIPVADSCWYMTETITELSTIILQ